MGGDKIYDEMAGQVLYVINVMSHHDLVLYVNLSRFTAHTLKLFFCASKHKQFGWQ